MPALRIICNGTVCVQGNYGWHNFDQLKAALAEQWPRLAESYRRVAVIATSDDGVEHIIARN